MTLHDILAMADGATHPLAITIDEKMTADLLADATFENWPQLSKSEPPSLEPPEGCTYLGNVGCVELYSFHVTKNTKMLSCCDA